MIELRDYQKECVDIVNGLPDGSKTVVAIATGLGKTATAAHFAFNGRMLWLSHRDELVLQPGRYFAEQNYSYGIEKAELHETGEDVVSASIQTISRDNRLKRFAPDAFDIIVCDEAHHAAAPTYRKVLSYFKPRKLIGLTATPRRGDSARLDDVFDDICFSRDLKWGIENGYLSRIRCLRVWSDYKMQNLEKVSGDYSVSSISKVLEDSNADMIVTKTYIDTCLREKRQTIIYCPNIKYCKIIEKTMKAALPKDEANAVRVLTQECSTDERRDILDDFRARRCHCIINCMILTEGADLPEISAIINCRPSANPTLYQQIIGRGTRLAEGKDYCLIIDVLGQGYKYKDLYTAPDLFGVDPKMLPPKMLEQMQKEDLLEFSEAITSERAKNAKQMQLAMEMVDFFEQQRLDLIRENWKDNTATSAVNIANAYRTMLETVPEEYDFGDIIVKREPTSSKHFHIQPTFGGHIYLSEPDMLGKTVIRASIPECGLAFISPPLPMHHAMKLVRNLLEHIVPPYYAQKWSKEARKNLATLPQTSKQSGRVFAEYQKLSATDASLNTKALNRLQSSDLIDLAIEIKNLRNERKILKKDDEPKKKGTKKYEAWLQEQKQLEEIEKRTEQNMRDAWESSLNRIKEAEKRGEARKKAERELIEKADSGEVLSKPIVMSYRYFRKDPNASEKQAAYIRFLLDKADKGGILFDKSPTDLTLDMWHTGFIINLLIALNEQGVPVKNRKVRYKLSAFVNEISKIESPENAPKTINIEYEIV